MPARRVARVKDSLRANGVSSPKTRPLEQAGRPRSTVTARLESGTPRDSPFLVRGRKAVRRAGIAGLRLHDLRHEATSRFFEKGLNVMEVASVTGHKTLQMLKRYTHLSVTDLATRLG